MTNTKSTRKIKFRAWDKALKKWVYIELNENGVVFTNASQNTLIRWTRGKRLGKWQQFTGLKDKNGVEIYEGDIVKAKHEDSRYDTGSVVYGGKGAFCLYLPNIATGIKTPLLNYIFGIGLAPESDFEVIGNIYENPELLGTREVKR